MNFSYDARDLPRSVAKDAEYARLSKSNSLCLSLSLSFSSFSLVLFGGTFEDGCVIGIYHADVRVNLNKEPLEEPSLYSRQRGTKSTGGGMDHPDGSPECT